MGGMFQLYSYFNKIICKANSGDTEQSPRSAASDLGLHCLPVPYKKGRYH